MAYATAANCRKAALLPSAAADKVDTALTDVYIPAATRRLTKWIGVANYADADYRDEVTAAEIFLALAGLYSPGLNTNLDKGKLLASQSGAQGGQTNWLTPAELKAMSTAWVNMAEREVEDIITLSEPSCPVKSYAYDEDGEAITGDD